MRAALDLSEAKASPHVFLDVWDQNHGARRFYERFGFVVIGARAFTLDSGAETTPDLIMVRDRRA